MKILFVTRPTVFSGPGGDTIQLLNTKEYLEKNFEILIDIDDGSETDYSKYDLIHFFNLRNPQDILKKVIDAKKAGIPLALSTIWGSYYECDQKARDGLQKLIANTFNESFIEYLKTMVRIFMNGNFHKGTLKYLLKGHFNSQREIINNIDVVLPNSPTEMGRVLADMKLKDKLGIVVPNAVNTKIFDYEKVDAKKYLKFKGCLLCASRIEVRKGQLDLIRAINQTNYQLVLVGQPSPNSIKYYNKCRQEASGNIHFIDFISQNDLAALYKVSKAHALISWMETPGLSSLEAGIMQSNILVTDRGDTKYYFGDLAEYCEPGDVNSILSGVKKVMEKDFDKSLAKKIKKNFTWEKTAFSTYQGYLMCLDKK